MKRGIFLMAALVCSLSVLTGAASAGYLVSNAPEPDTDANGLYCETGQLFFDRPVYRKAGTLWEIRYYPGFEGYWVIGMVISEDPGFESVFGHDDDGYTPPLTGWWEFNPGKAPVPIILVEQPCPTKSVPTVTEWGMVAMSAMLLLLATWFIRRRKHTN